MADNLRKYKSLFSTTTTASFSTGSSETITLNSVTGLPTSTEITLTFNRVDTAGSATATLMERIVGTISGSNLVIRTSPSSGRGFDSTTEQSHASGAVVEMIWNAADWNSMVDWGTTEHNQDGTHKAATVTTLKASGANIVTGTSDTTIVTPKAIKDAADGLITLTDVTTNDVSTTKHGFVPKAPNDTTKFLNGVGAFSVPVAAIMPSTITTNDGGGNVTTSGTTEATVISTTITNPSVAGRIFIIATFGTNSASVANDVFSYKLYFGTSPTLLFTSLEPVYSTSGGGRNVVQVVFQTAVAASGSQQLKMTITRNSGTGTIVAQNGECSLTWFIIPGASSTA